MEKKVLDVYGVYGGNYVLDLSGNKALDFSRVLWEGHEEGRVNMGEVYAGYDSGFLYRARGKDGFVEVDGFNKLFTCLHAGDDILFRSDFADKGGLHEGRVEKFSWDVDILGISTNDEKGRIAIVGKMIGAPFDCDFVYDALEMFGKRFS